MIFQYENHQYKDCQQNRACAGCGSAGNTTRLLHVAELMNEARKALATR